jgi:hypothetical protein
MPNLREIARAKQLLVEGRDAEVFFGALLAEIGLDAVIQVQVFGAVNELPGFLKQFVVAPNFTQAVDAIAVIRDAETDARGALQSVRGALERAGLTVPAAVEVFEGTRPKVAVMILPDASTRGMLETVCLSAVENDPAMPCVREYLACVAKSGSPPPSNTEKATLHAFLASRPKPHLLLGQAAWAGYFPWESPAFDAMKRLLKAM